VTGEIDPLVGALAYREPDPSVLRPAPPARGFADVRPGAVEQVDVVIAGAGPGGGSVARVLAEAGLRVMVLEEGPSSSRFRPNYANVSRFHMQEAGTMVARGSAMMPIAAGRGLGGSTLVNSALSFRPAREVLDGWAAALDEPGLSWQALQPLYDEVSELVGVSVTPDRVAGENNRLIVRGIEALGLPGGLAPRSTPGCTGCGVCYYGCPTGGKASTNLTLLPRAAAAGAVLQAEVKVVEVLVDEGPGGPRAAGLKAVAVHPETGALGEVLTVKARHVVLSAGAVGTPRLMWHSGLAGRLGPHCGEHLSVHPGSTVLSVAPHEVQLWRGATQGAYFHPPTLPGVLPHTFSAPPEACLVAGGFVGDRFQEGLALLPRLCGMLLMVSDHGHGRVRAFSDGRADLVYDFDPADVQRIKDGLVEVARVLQAGGAGPLYVPVHGVGRCDSPEQLAQRLADRSIRDFTLYAAHPMGTSRMGRSAADGVVDPSGQAYGLPGLWIADAGLFPSSLGVNPQLSTMALAHWVARRLVAQA
jgi:choline dehydrogenase-like flavoprotein